MDDDMTLLELFAIYTKYFFILTPFFIIAVFLAVTEMETVQVRHKLAVRVTLGIVCISIVLFLFGQSIFSLFGITIDAFRLGAGALLFLSSVDLVQGKMQVPAAKRSIMDLAVVPLAIPVTIGPGAVGALFVMGGEIHGLEAQMLAITAIAAAGVSVGVLLYLSEQIKRMIGRSGISMLSKVTGLILSALSCQMMFEGIAAFLK